MATKKVAERTRVGTIDVTPTWRGVLPILLTIIRDGNQEGVKIAERELARMADLADKYVEANKPPTIIDGV